jgi:HPt (histidine-containing phosphotransfer) domain-containing protein
MMTDLDVGDAPSAELVCLRSAGVDGPSIRRELRRQLSAREYNELMAGFASDMRGRFARMHVKALTSDAFQVASVADMLGFPELSLACRRLVIACDSGAGILDALASLSIAQTSVMLTLAIEADQREPLDSLAA